MKKIFTLSLLSLVLSSSLQAQNYEWAEELVRLNPEVVDSVVPIMNSDDVGELYQSCMIYYHQPLEHDNLSLGNIPLRAVFSVRKTEQYKDRMVQMSIGGYDLNSEFINSPNHHASSDSLASHDEITFHYKGHILRPEHRFFGTSCPENPLDMLEYCNAKEAAADFHALAEAVKKVFKGKWAISGVSKGGTTTAIQHAYYPDDADCYIPYSGPIMNSEHDLRLQEYWMSETWTPEIREHILHIQKEMLNRPGVFKKYIGSIEIESPEHEALIRCQFLESVGLFDTDLHSYYPREMVQNDIEENKSRLKEQGLDDYTDEMLAYMCSYSKLSFPASGIEKMVWIKKNTPSLYQFMHELGYFDFKWDYFYDTKEEADSVNTLWRTYVTDLITLTSKIYFKGVTFDPSLMNFVRQQTASATKPMLFIYGSDDYWTGAHIEDEYVNGDNVRCYILPEQNHDVSIACIEDTDKQNELWAFLDQVFRNNPDAIEQINQPAAGAKSRYNLMGQPTDEAQGLSIENGRVIFKK